MRDRLSPEGLKLPYSSIFGENWSYLRIEGNYVQARSKDKSQLHVFYRLSTFFVKKISFRLLPLFEAFYSLLPRTI